MSAQLVDDEGTFQAAAGITAQGEVTISMLIAEHVLKVLLTFASPGAYQCLRGGAHAQPGGDRSAGTGRLAAS